MTGGLVYSSRQRAETARMFWLGGLAMLRAAYVPVRLAVCGGFVPAVDVEASLRYWQ